MAPHLDEEYEIEGAALMAVRSRKCSLGRLSTVEIHLMKMRVEYGFQTRNLLAEAIVRMKALRVKQTWFE